MVRATTDLSENGVVLQNDWVGGLVELGILKHKSERPQLTTICKEHIFSKCD